MSWTESPSTAKPYGLARVTAAWGLPRSTYYARRHRLNHPVESRKRGLRTAWTDEVLTERIREQIAASPFSPHFSVRHGKASSSNGCETRPTTVAPVGSSQGGSWRQR